MDLFNNDVGLYQGQLCNRGDNSLGEAIYRIKERAKVGGLKVIQ